MGATMGLRIGQIIGTLEGVWSTVRKANKAAENSGDIGGADRSEEERLRDLVLRARHDLRTEGVYGKEYWGPGGIWTYEAKEGDGGWSDIVDAHPLVQKWEKTVRVEVVKVNLDTGVLERGEAKRLGEDETS